MLWSLSILFFFLCSTPEFACLLTQKVVQNFCLSASNLWRDAASTIHYCPLLLPGLHLSSHLQLYVSGWKVHKRRSVCFCQKHSFDSRMCGVPMRKSESAGMTKKPGKILLLWTEGHKHTGERMTCIWENGGLPLWFLSSYRRVVAENEESFLPPFFGFFEMPWLM